MRFKEILKTLGLISLSGLFFYGADAMAQDTSTIGGVATTITGSFAALAQLITAVAYIAGMGFGMAAILKFKAHKDNPQQIPVGTPIALLFVAAALLFLPTLFGVARNSVFGESAQSGGVSGVTTIA